MVGPGVLSKSAAMAPRAALSIRVRGVHVHAICSRIRTMSPWRVARWWHKSGSSLMKNWHTSDVMAAAPRVIACMGELFLM
jgi:hypothetical protein